MLLISCERGEPPSSAASADQPTEVTVMAAKPMSLPISLETIAQTEGAKEIEIRPRVGGILLKRLYAEGAAVKAGEPLFLIDPEPFQYAVAEAKAQLQELSLIHI